MVWADCRDSSRSEAGGHGHVDWADCRGPCRLLWGVVDAGLGRTIQELSPCLESGLLYIVGLGVLGRRELVFGAPLVFTASSKLRPLRGCVAERVARCRRACR